MSQPTPLDPAVKNAWGTILNTDFSLIDAAVAGLLGLDCSAGGTIILTSTPGAADQARNALFNLTGVIPSNTTILWPQNVTGRFVVKNATTGNHAVTLAINNGSGVPAGTSVTLAQGNVDSFFTDGTNFASATSGQVPTRTVLTSGSSATYSTPAGCRQLRIRLYAGGGGGASNSLGASDGGNGGTSAFHGITAIGGTGGLANGNAGLGGTGGSDTPTSGSVAGLVRRDGNAGSPGGPATVSTAANGGNGGAGPLGGGTANTNSAKANSGAGGSGQGVSSAAATSGGGAGAGEYVEFFINTPAPTYLYTIGPAGAGGLGGGNGGSGEAIIDEIY